MGRAPLLSLCKRYHVEALFLAMASQYGATNPNSQVTRVTLRRDESSGAEPHTKGVGRK
jgi:hypothetical protein